MLLQLFLCTFLNFYSPSHDIAMAIFAITLEENTIQLKIKLDKGNMDTVLRVMSNKNNLSQNMAIYLSQHTTWIMGDQPIEFKINGIQENEEYYFLETLPVEVESSFETLKLNNTCLVEAVTGQNNVIYIKQKNKEMRGFRMNRQRTTISVDL